MINRNVDIIEQKIWSLISYRETPETRLAHIQSLRLKDIKLYIAVTELLCDRLRLKTAGKARGESVASYDCYGNRTTNITMNIETTIPPDDQQRLTLLENFLFDLKKQKINLKDFRKDFRNLEAGILRTICIQSLTKPKNHDDSAQIPEVTASTSSVENKEVNTQPTEALGSLDEDESEVKVHYSEVNELSVQQVREATHNEQTKLALEALEKYQSVVTQNLELSRAFEAMKAENSRLNESLEVLRLQQSESSKYAVGLQTQLARLKEENKALQEANTDITKKYEFSKNLLQQITQEKTLQRIHSQAEAKEDVAKIFKQSLIGLLDLYEPKSTTLFSSRNPIYSKLKGLVNSQNEMISFTDIEACFKEDALLLSIFQNPATPCSKSTTEIILVKALAKCFAEQAPVEMHAFTAPRPKSSQDD